MLLNIQALKQTVTMQQILEHYEISLHKASSCRLSGPCPIHQGDNPQAFQVDLNKNLFHCFTHCGGGSIFDFVMKMENSSFFNAALKINSWFPSIQKLKLAPDHSFLEQRSIKPILAEFFELGFCSYGLLKNRIAIPLHNTKGNILGYMGRAISASTSPKYLFPKNFKKTAFLFNFHRIKKASAPIFIVEGPFDVIHLHNLGFNAVALLGCNLSYEQLLLLKELKQHFILLMDGDNAGYKASKNIAQKMEQENLDFKTILLQANLDPKNLTKPQLSSLRF